MHRLGVIFLIALLLQPATGFGQQKKGPRRKNNQQGVEEGKQGSQGKPHPRYKQSNKVLPKSWWRAEMRKALKQDPLFQKIIDNIVAADILAAITKGYANNRQYLENVRNIRIMNKLPASDKGSFAHVPPIGRELSPHVVITSNRYMSPGNPESNILHSRFELDGFDFLLADIAIDPFKRISSRWLQNK